MLNPFVSAYRFFKRKKAIYFFMVFSLLIISGYFASEIRLEEDIFRMIPSDSKSRQFELAYKNTKLLDKLVVRIFFTDSIIENDPNDLINYAEEFVDKIEKEFDSTSIRDIQFKMDDLSMDEIYDEFYQNLPIFLDKENYQMLDSLISYQSIQDKIADNYKILISPASLAMKKFLVKDPLGLTNIVLDKLKLFKLDENFEIYKDCIVTLDKRNLLVLITPANPSSETFINGKMLRGIELAIDSLNQKYKSIVHAEFFGGVAVADANASRVKKDVLITVGAAFLLILFIMTLFYRQRRMIIVLVIPIIFGGTIALAIIFLAQSIISAIAMGVGSVLVGISIDYALHFFTHYQNTGSAEKTLKDISAPVIYSCLTTAAAFFCLSFVSSFALRDMGWFAGLSVIFAAIISLLILPHLVKKKRKPSLLPFISTIASWPFHKKWYLKLGIVIITIITLFYFRDVQFEDDLEKMSYMPDHLKKAEQNLNSISSVSLRSIYLVNIGNSLNDALQKNENLKPVLEKLKNKGLIKSHILPSTIMVSDSLQKLKIQRWNNFWRDRKEVLKNSLDNAIVTYGFRKNVFDEFNELIDKEFKPIRVNDLQFIHQLYLDDLINKKDSLTLLVTTLKLDLEDKEEVHKALENIPDLVIIDKQYMAKRFVDLLRGDLSLLVIISLSVVFMILLIVFGRFELAVITFIPMIISWIWTLGIMALIGIKFNIFNIIVSTFIFGLGIDYSIFITRGLLQKFKFGQDNLLSYKTSILLSAITTICGIGVLIFAKHPALQSMALVSVIGILSVLIITYTLQPGLFYWLINTKGKKRFAPITLLDFFFSILTIIVWVSGTIMLTILGFILFFLKPLSRKKTKYLYHYAIKLACWFQIYVNIHLKKTIIGFDKKKFRKPAIIIANHQSHIDILLILMQYPKIIVLTNRKVHRRIYGLLVKMADFYPVTADGIDDSLEKIKKRVDEGYSILVFPEGTRSRDTTIHRFHRGAFYMAEQLNLDILPIILHGVGDCMKQGQLFLRFGSMTVKILDRIPLEDKSLGKDYKERTKQFKKFILEKYLELEKEFGGADYQAHRLQMNFIFRGVILEWYLRIKLLLEKNYKTINKFIPEEGVITDLGCGYGFITYMLAFISNKRQLIGIDYDEDKIRVANHAYYKSSRLKFIHEDITRVKLQRSDAFILSDTLHYIPEKEQEKLLIRCNENLNENGVIIIREGDRDLEEKHKGTKLTEFLSTKILGFNKIGDSKKLYFTNREMIRKISSRLHLYEEIIDKTKLTSNILIILRKRKSQHK